MELPARRNPIDYPAEQIRDLIVRSTKQCVLENARRYWPRLKYVVLRVTGDPEFSNLSGNFPLERITAHVAVRLGE